MREIITRIAAPLTSQGPHWYFLAIFVALAMITPLFSLIFGDSVYYGSMISWQFFPITIKAFHELSDFRYGFFTFDFALGFDALGDSQQSFLHPIKLALMAFSESPYIVDTLFLNFHFALLGIATYCLASRFLGPVVGSAERDLAALFCCLSFCLGSAIFANLIHPFFIASLSYGFILIILVDKFVEQPTRFGAISISLSSALLLLCGNFAIQWLIFLFVFLFIVFKKIVNEISNGKIIYISFFISLGFLVAAPQLLPTLDLMTVSSRSVAGGIDKFEQSPGPIQWLAYLNPSASHLIWKYAPEIYRSIGDNSVAEGIHYVGVLPLAIIIARLCNKSKLSSVELVLSGCLIFFVFRALGVFSPINIILNYLPFFGQFRVPVRSLFIVDILICILAAINLRSVIETQQLAASLKRLFFIAFVMFLLSVGLIVFRAIKINIDMPSVSAVEAAYLFLPCLIIACLISVLSLKNVPIQARSAFVVFFALIDLTVHLGGVPTHWRAESAQLLQQRALEFDRICGKSEASGVFALNRTWPEFDIPLFPIGKGNAPHYVTEDGATPEINGETCTLTYSLSTSTLTPSAVPEAMAWAARQAGLEDQLGALHLLGVTHAAGFTTETGRGKVSDELQIVPTPSASDRVQADFLKLSESVENTAGVWRLQLIEFWYKTLLNFDLVSRLPSTDRIAVAAPDGSSQLFLSPPFSYLITDGVRKLPVQSVRGGVINVTSAGGGVGTLRVIYIPAAFLTGLVVSLAGILVLIMAVPFNHWYRNDVRVDTNQSSRPRRLAEFIGTVEQNLSIGHSLLFAAAATSVYRLFVIRGVSPIAVIDLVLIAALSGAVLTLFWRCLHPRSALMLGLSLFTFYTIGLNVLKAS